MSLARLNWPEELNPETAVAEARELARLIGRRYPKWVARRLEDEAVAHMALHIASYCPQPGGYRRWCATASASW